MMKSTFATLALASVAMTASAAPFQSALYKTLDLGEAEACKVTGLSKKVLAMIPADIYYIEAATAAEADACIKAATKTEATADQIACAPKVSDLYTVKPGTNKSCAIAAGSECTKDKICQNVQGSPEDQKSCVVPTAPAKSFCPTGFAPTTGDFVKLVLGSDLVVNSADWTKSVGAAWTAANAKVAECNFGEADAEYISNAKATERTQMLLDAGCVAAKQTAWKTEFEAVLKAYNDAKNTVKATANVAFSKAAAVDFKACFNNNVTDTAPEWFCATTKDCTIPCGLNESCTDAKQCGTGKCAVAPKKAAMITQADEAKVCVASSSVMAVVAPVLAAVLAVAFF